MVKKRTMAEFECCAFCFVTPWFIFIIYIGSTDVDVHETL